MQETLEERLARLRLELFGSEKPATAAMFGERTSVSLDAGARSIRPEPRAGQHRSMAGAQSAVAHDYIDAHIRMTDLSPDRICANIGVSRRSLYRMFENSGGVSSYIWSRRLDLTFEAITACQTDSRLGEIALSFGFQSEPHFSRAFQKRFAILPSELRTLANAGPSTALWVVTARKAAIDDGV